MPTLPWFSLYPRDLLLATQSWSDEEFGAYVRLLCYQWEHGSIPMDEARLSRLVDNLDRVWPVIREKFPNGVNPRLEAERKIADRRVKSQSKGGRAGAAARWGRPKGQAPTHPGPSPDEPGTGTRGYEPMAYPLTDPLTEPVPPPLSDPVTTPMDIHIHNTQENQESAFGARPRPSSNGGAGARRRAPTPPRPSVGWTVDGGWEGITDSIREAWQKACPKVDIERELAGLHAWLMANPGERNKRQWHAFILRNLNRAQAKAETRPVDISGRRGRGL